MPIDYVLFDPQPCGFPRPRIPPLPDGLTGISIGAGKRKASPIGAFRHFTRGRYALREAYRLAGIGRDTALLAPAYHCRTMLDPALALGSDVILYSLAADLSPDIAALTAQFDQLKRPVKALLATHFFGFPQQLANLASWCAHRSITLVEDCSHALFCEQYQPPTVGVFGDMVVSSPYKFLPCPDGGLLYSSTPERLDSVSTRAQPLIAEVRGMADSLAKARQHARAAKTCQAVKVATELATISARHVMRGLESRQRSEWSADYQPAEEGVASLRLSRFLARQANVPEITRQRRDNYARWVDGLAKTPNCRPLLSELPPGCFPYMLPLYLDYPDPHFYYLKHLGVPVWRWDSMAASSCPTANDYRLHLLHLPCHQSLSRTELAWMIACVDKALRQPVP